MTAAEEPAAQGLALVQAGRLEEAAQVFALALRHSPTSLEPRLGLAHVLERLGDPWAAAAWLSDACRVGPAREDLWLELARLLARTGRDAELDALLGTALNLHPSSVHLLQLQGELLLKLRQLDRALVTWRRLAALLPGDAAVALNHGFCLEHSHALEEAIASYRRALAARPGFVEAHVDLAGILWRVGDFEGAMRHAQEAVALAPEHPYAVRILGTACLNVNKVDEAEQALRRALQLQPEFALAEIDLAFALLLAGKLEEGWRLYARRWRDTERMKRPAFFQPDREWQGRSLQPLEGKRIAVYAEQGLGDVIQFIRYVLKLQQDGAAVCCVVQPELVSLVEHSMPDVPCLVPGRTLQADYHVALLDLPLHYATTLDEIPRAVPYLHASEGKVAQWAARMPAAPGQLRVGFAWCGSALQVNNNNRSMRLSDLRPVLELPHLQCFSLQKSADPCFTDIEPASERWTDLTREWADFADSAAMIQNLDLVITVDTAIAHLAGAMGKEVWVMLAPNADWRYLLHRTDSPWYPSMRLFRREFGEPRSAQVGRVLSAIQARI